MGPTLVVLAAGMSNRFGGDGMKQVEPVGLSGEVIAEFSVYDALRAGFGKALFVVRRGSEGMMRERILDRMQKAIEVECAFQELGDVPAAYGGPGVAEGRERPWGTGHAVLACRDAVRDGFAVVNADDYYGPAAFRMLAGHLREAGCDPRSRDYCVIGFEVGRTLPERGAVSRAVCETDGDGMLMGIREINEIGRKGDRITYAKARPGAGEAAGGGGETGLAELDPATLVSMNAWGFTPAVFGSMLSGFGRFLNEGGRSAAAEYYLPTAVGDLVDRGEATVRVYRSMDTWYGVTFKDDAAAVREGVRRMVAEGLYPESLWG
ncbi:MAG: nucleotidyltransferase [Oscillospiraceae bacterium]|nr:nucleotidyltransferase [Oscillospiraceae bacterium]